MPKKWKYDDFMCIGCKVREETGEELLLYESVGEEGEENMT